MRGANFQNANLHNASLRHARLNEADLSDADLSGADLAEADLTGAILLNTTLADGRVQADDLDAELLALELSGQLLPPKSLHLKIRRDLRAIRAAFPEMASIHHRARWIPGQALAKVTPEQLQRINDSELGPVTVEQIGFGWQVLRFRKRYNPDALVPLLQARFQVSSAEPNFLGGDGNNILHDRAASRYAFSRGWGDCPAGCIEKHFWVFAVEEGGAVRLVEEYGSPLPRAAARP